jgi:DNA-binding NarL/FixJ family response regulator
MLQPTVLLVDDEPSLRLAVKTYLEDAEFTVWTAANPKEAWQILDRSIPDLVITDVMMPQEDGYAFLKQLRDNPRCAHLPVIFLTAKGMTTDRIQGYNAGCDAYLPKPFDPDELVAIAENLIAKRLPHQEQAGDLAGQIAEIKTLLQQRSALQTVPAPIKIEFTPREQSVLELVVAGLMNKEIAKQQGTTIRNVEKYVSRLFTKTGTSSRTELVRYALQHGLVNL